MARAELQVSNLHFHLFFITFAADFGEGESLMSKLRSYYQQQTAGNIRADGTIMAAFTVKRGSNVRGLRLALPANAALHRRFLCLAEENNKKSNTAFKESSDENSFGTKGKMKEKADAAKEFAAHSLNSAKTALLFNPSSIRAYILKGQSLFALGKPEKAIAPFSMAILLSTRPESKARLLFVRGNIHHQLGDYQKAIADYRKLLSLQNGLDASCVKVLLGGCYVRSGKLERGVAIMREAYSVRMPERNKVDWELASSTVSELMYVVAVLSKKGRHADVQSLLDQWANWRNL